MRSVGKEQRTQMQVAREKKKGCFDQGFPEAKATGQHAEG